VGRVCDLPIDPRPGPGAGRLLERCGDAVSVAAFAGTSCLRSVRVLGVVYGSKSQAVLVTLFGVRAR